MEEKKHEDIKKIEESPYLLIFADKTSNIYKMKPEDHRKLLTENITKTYKKAPERIETAINFEAKNIVKKLKTRMYGHRV